MTLRISLVLLASLLFVTVLATLSKPAAAYFVLPEAEAELSSVQWMATGPLNVVVLSSER